MNKKKLIRWDWAMKNICRDKANFDVLEGFLCALLEDDNIKILHLIESESDQQYETDKFNRVDIMVEDSRKRKIIIEVQNTRESDYLERLLFGTSKVIIENQELGKDFRDISKVISISILYFNLGTGDDYLYKGTTDLIGMNTGNPLKIKKREKIIENFKPKIGLTEKNIFPEYYFIQVERYKNVVKKKIDEWIYMIKNNDVRDDFKSKNIKKAKKKLELLNMTEEERKVYEKYLINLVSERDMIRTARQEGEDKGRKQGRKEGEQNKAIIVAKKAIKKGMSIEDIIELTGLTKQEINQI